MPEARRLQEDTSRQPRRRSHSAPATAPATSRLEATATEIACEEKPPRLLLRLRREATQLLLRLRLRRETTARLRLRREATARLRLRLRLRREATATGTTCDPTSTVDCHWYHLEQIWCFYFRVAVFSKFCSSVSLL